FGSTEGDGSGHSLIALSRSLTASHLSRPLSPFPLSWARRRWLKRVVCVCVCLCVCVCVCISVFLSLSVCERPNLYFIYYLYITYLHICLLYDHLKPHFS